MKLKAKAKDLVAMLKSLAGAVETKSTIPVLSSVLLDGKRMLAVATDLEVAMRFPLAGDMTPSKAGGEALCVNLKKLLALFGAMDGEVTLEGLENHWTQVKNGRAKAKVVGFGPENFPVLDEVAGRSATLPKADFQSAIRRTSFAVTTEDSRYTLQGAQLEIADGKFSLAATNGNHLSLAHGKADGDALKLIIPRKALALLEKFDSEAEQVKLTVSETMAKFEFGEAAILCRLLVGQFPNYRNVLPGPGKTRATFDAGEFQATVSKVLPMADSRSYALKLEIGDDKILISTQSAEAGEAEAWLAAKTTGQSLTVGVNAQFLSGFMGKAEGEVNLSATSPEAALDFQSGSDWRYVLMPLRI